MYGVHIAKVLAHVGGARISKKSALTFIRIVRVHHAHETEWFSGVSRFFFLGGGDQFCSVGMFIIDVA